jgi:hypothetical protein
MLFRVSAILTMLTAAAITLSYSREQGFSTESATANQPPQAERPDCKNPGKCVDRGPYIATVTDIFESDTPYSHQVRLTLKFDNLSESPIILAYRAHSAFLLDNFKNRFFCCKNDSAPDASAIGIGTDTEAKVDPSFLLRAHENATVLFDLWRRRPPNVQAAHYDFDLMIDEIDPSNMYVVQQNPYISFRRLVPRRGGNTNPQSAAQKQSVH